MFPRRRAALSLVVLLSALVSGAKKDAGLRDFVTVTSDGGHVFSTHNTEHMRVTSAGKVGIGTTSPQAPLDIAGTEIEMYDPGQSGNNYSYIKTTATTFNTQTLTLGTTQGYSTPVDALSVYNGSVTVARSLAAGVNNQTCSSAGACGSVVFDLSLGNTQQLTCGYAGAIISSSLSSSRSTPGETVTFILVQDGTTACTFGWPSNVRGHGTVSTTLSSINVQTFIVSNNGSDLYPIGPMQTTSGGTP